MKSYMLVVVCIVCVILCVVAVIVDYFNVFPKFSSYLSNIAIECLSIVVTLLVIHKALELHNDNKVKQRERQKILEHNEVIVVYIEFYKRFLRCIVTPLDNKRFENMSFPMKFDIKDMMQNLYKFSGVITTSLKKPSIELFLEQEKNLRNAFISSLNNIEFVYYKEIKKLMLKYIKLSVGNNTSDFILNEGKFSNGKEFSKQMEETLTPKIDEYYELYKQNKLESNAAISYCILYDLINNEQDIIMQYLQEIERIASSHTIVEKAWKIQGLKCFKIILNEKA